VAPFDPMGRIWIIFVEIIEMISRTIIKYQGLSIVVIYTIFKDENKYQPFSNLSDTILTMQSERWSWHDIQDSNLWP